MQNFPEPTRARMAAPEGLMERSIAAIQWHYLGVAGRIVAQVLVQIALARLLGPDTFGLFPFGALINALGGLVVEMGLGAALVQAREITRSDISFVFTRVIVAGICMAAIVFFSASLVSDFFGDPRIT